MATIKKGTYRFNDNPILNVDLTIRLPLYIVPVATAIGDITCETLTHLGANSNAIIFTKGGSPFNGYVGEDLISTTMISPYSNGEWVFKYLDSSYQEATLPSELNAQGVFGRVITVLEDTVTDDVSSTWFNANAIAQTEETKETPTADSIKAKIKNLIAKANSTTGKNDTDLTSGVNSLIEGFGSGETLPEWEGLYMIAGGDE